MAKTRNWGTGRDCLLAGPDGTLPQAIARGLATASFAVRRAATEAEALAALEQQPFAVAFASQKLGTMALSSIIARAAQRHPEVPVVVAGSTGTVQEAVDAMQLGAADYIVAAFEPEQLDQGVAGSNPVSPTQIPADRPRMQPAQTRGLRFSTWRVVRPTAYDYAFLLGQLGRQP